MTPRVFLEDNGEELRALAASRQALVTFNGLRFDLPLLSECWRVDLSEMVQVDLKVLIEQAAGLGRGNHRKGYSLDRILEANSLAKKPGDSALAPLQWQRGEFGAVIDKCLGDVTQTAALLERAAVRSLTDPVTGVQLDLSLVLSTISAGLEERLA